MIVTTENGKVLAIGYFTKKHTEKQLKEWREKYEKRLKTDPAFKAQAEADLLIQDFNGGVRKYAYVKSNKTGFARWISKKEYDCFIKAGINIKTDF